MKILHLISSAGQYGAENMLVELAAAQETLGNQVRVMVIENRNPRSLDVYRLAQKRGLDAEVLPLTGKISVKNAEKIKASIRRNGIDAVHCHGYKSDFYGLWGARGTVACTVATCHGWPGSSIPLHIYYFTDKLLLRHFDHVVAVSDRVQNILRGWNIPGERISQITNGIDTDRFLNSDAAGDRDKQPSGRKRIGTVSRLSPEKGIPFLLRAVHGILQEFPETELCLVGEGPERGDLEKLANELGIGANVQFWGLQTDVPAVYSKLDIFVLPSLQEGMPMAVLEAMAAGKAIVASRVGSVPVVVHQDKTGTLVEPTDVGGLSNAILRYLRDPTVARQHGQNAAEMVRQNFSAKSMASKYLEVYRIAGERHRVSATCERPAV